jgi:hypothetical protein
MSDIEARVAELFTERLQRNKNVVNKEDVEQNYRNFGINQVSWWWRRSRN